jgi:hypothetical protein
VAIDWDDFTKKLGKNAAISPEPQGDGVRDGDGTLTRAPASLGAVPLPQAGEVRDGTLTRAPASLGAVPLPQAGEVRDGTLSRAPASLGAVPLPQAGEVRDGTLTRAPASLGAVPLPQAGEARDGTLTRAPASLGAVPLPQAGEVRDGTLTRAPASLGAVPLPQAGEARDGTLTRAPASLGAVPLPQAGEVRDGTLSRLRERASAKRAGEGSHSALWSIGICLTVLIALLAAVSSYEERTFDSYVHMFFADHYRRSWFNTWEPRWYGGFSTTTYPPLTHQLVALASYLFGFEKGFVFITFGSVLGITFGLTKLAARFSLRSPPVLALWLFTLTPTVHRFAYVYAQLPTLLATTFAIYVAVWLDDWLNDGRWLDLVGFVALIGATAGMHHVTLLFEAGMCALMVIRRVDWRHIDRTLVKRTVIAGGSAAVVVAMIVWPFVVYARAQPQVEIPHFTRDPLWLRTFGVDIVEQVVFILASLAFALLAVWQQRRDVMWLALATFVIALFSAGGTTPLPKLVFGAQFHWLTFDKFHLWASALFALTIAASVRVSERALLALCLLLLPVVLIQVSHKAADQLQPPFVRDISGPLAVLNSEGAENYRHLTLGFGDQLCRFDLYGKSPSVDGDYHTARTDEVLRKSGVATLDAAKYYDKGPDILRYVLGAANEKSLRWVLVVDDWYYPYLFEAGFDLAEVYPSGISLFEKSDVPALGPAPHERGLATYVWGAGPLSLLVLAAVVTFLKRRSQNALGPPIDTALGDV